MSSVTYAFKPPVLQIESPTGATPVADLQMKLAPNKPAQPQRLTFFPHTDLGQAYLVSRLDLEKVQCLGVMPQLTSTFEAKGLPRVKTTPEGTIVEIDIVAFVNETSTLHAATGVGFAPNSVAAEKRVAAATQDAWEKAISEVLCHPADSKGKEL